MRIVKGSTVMTRTTLKMATFMLATAIRPTQDQPNSTSDNVRQWSDSPTGPTGPTAPTVPTVRQCPTVPDRAHRPCHSDKGPTVRQLPDSCPTVVRQFQPDSARQCPTVPTVCPTAPTVPTARAQSGPAAQLSELFPNLFAQLCGIRPGNPPFQRNLLTASSAFERA